jgi:hypothetical protein
VKVENTTTERKTAENLLDLIEVVKHKLENDWGVMFIAFVTDGSGEAAKACKLLHNKYLQIIVLHCYTHLVSNLWFVYVYLICNSGSVT